MPAWNRGSSTSQMFPSAVLVRRVRRSARASAIMNWRRSQSAATYSRRSGSAVECGSNTYSTSLYSPVSLTLWSSHVVHAERLDPAVAHVLGDHLVGIAELGDPTLVQPQRLGRHHLHRAEAVRHQHDRSPLTDELRGLLGDVLAERGVPAGERFVDEQDLGIEEHGDR